MLSFNKVSLSQGHCSSTQDFNVGKTAITCVNLGTQRYSSFGEDLDLEYFSPNTLTAQEQRACWWEWLMDSVKEFLGSERGMLLCLSARYYWLHRVILTKMFLFPRVSLRSCSLQKQPDTAPLTGKELYPFAPRGFWHDALCARVTWWNETCTAKQVGFTWNFTARWEPALHTSTISYELSMTWSRCSISCREIEMYSYD